MKKVLLLGAVALFATGMFVTSCDDDSPVSCAGKLINVSTAASAYNSDQSDANCTTYKNALSDYIDCDGVTATDKAYYQLALEALPCYP
ncbi:hypothetical protein ACFLQ3_03190 [Bacteroidota bacterium]